MKKAPAFRILSTLVLLVAMSSLMQASAITGSLPAVLFSATENGPTLALSTIETAAQTITSGVGTGDFSVVPVMTTFGPITLNDLSIGTGGGFSIFNATYGGFTATSGAIITQTSHFLNVSLSGTYTPGLGIAGVSAGPAVANVSFTQTGTSVSGSLTLATVPEPLTLAFWGAGILGCAYTVRSRRLV
jgi:hypothetical protein